MPIEEQAEEKIQNAIQNIITGGARLGLRISKDVALALLRTGAHGSAKLIQKGAQAAVTAVKDKINSGEMSEKRLQQKKGGDIHELQLDDSTMREVQRSLKEAGIDYHPERTDDGQFFVHFAGKDEDHVRHAVRRAFKNMGLEIPDEDFTVEQPAQQEQAREQTQASAEETPRVIPQKPEVKPAAPQRIAWDFVEPEVMEMAANSLAARHPELSWGNLMGDTKWNEQTGREFADRIIGKAAADPNLRGELDTILHNDYGQGAQTQEQARNQTPEQAQSSPEQEPASESKDTPTRQAQAKTTTRKPENKEEKPKPIRSKKALLDRFKTKLNENLAEQKNHQAPKQNRDRTPRKGR